MQTVRLGIDCDAIEGSEFRKQLGQLSVGLDHGLKLQIPSTKLQKSSKHQAPKKLLPPIRKLRATVPSMFDIWCFSGAWSLEFGAFPLISIRSGAAPRLSSSPA